ncbi:MAG: SMP-30/gluconolactonase/LRE family protein [Verrucomicrobiaceae bacterium]
MRILGILTLLTASLFGKGTLTKHQFTDSKIFPGTQRDYWTYVPGEYDASKPACLMVFQDGGGFVNNPGKTGYAPDVIDQLIASGDMPVTIGLFVNPGVVPAPRKGAQPRFNRSFEYDGMGPNYANFLIEELIPTLNLNISPNPDDRGLCGASSGAIAAFTAAWERPDHFRRVYSMIGTYVGLRGGNNYPALIRKTEPKPLRIFLQDGSNDLNIYGGDWWMANQTMQRALEFAGYEHTHRWDEGKHSREEGTKIMAEALTWLWKDHGKTPVTTHLDNAKSRASEWLIPGENWQVVSEGHNWSEGLALTPDGTLYFTDVPDSELWKVTPDGKETLLAKDTAKANGIALGPDGKKLYTASAGQIRAYDLATGTHQVISEGAGANDIVVSHRGHLYFTDPAKGKVWHINLETKKTRSVDNLKGLNGIGMSADQTLLFVCQFDGPFIYSYSIQEDGSLTNKQPYFYAQGPTNSGRYALDGQCTASNGHLLVGTEAGLQIFDQPGRVQLVLPRPAYEDGRVNYSALYKDTLYIATRHRIYKRKIKLSEAPAWKAPVGPPKPRL